MIMEALEDDHTHIMIKGKRTTRPRQPSPIRFIMPLSSSSVGPRLTEDLAVNQEIGSPTTSSATQSNVEEEDQDMANCLILLAQGRNKRVNSVPNMASLGNNIPSGLYGYECKTCNRCFPSFQALGGHRASHKKPKLNEMDNKKIKSTIFMEDDTTLSLQMSSSNMLSSIKPTKVHECSICGADFSSGQALGGHMRRHRTVVNNNITAATTTTATTMTTIMKKSSIITTSSRFQSPEIKKDRNVLELDLNLPAPEDCDQIESKFSFASKEQVIVLSASPLVDCHY